MIKRFELTLYQSGENRTKKKCSLKIPYLAQWFTLAVPDSLLHPTIPYIS